MDEIRNLEEKVYEGERRLQEQRNKLQTKVDKSEYIQNMRKKEIQLAKERGETLAQLKHKKEMLEEDRERIMDDLEKAKSGDPSILRKNEASRWAANDILSKGKSDFKNLQISQTMKDKLVSGQAKINKLKEEQKKIEKEAFPVIDELDILEKQYEDKAFNQKAQIVANDIEMRPARPELKAEQLNLMRRKLEENGGPQDYNSKLDLENKMNNLEQEYRNNGDIDPAIAHGMADLQKSIKDLGNNAAPIPGAPVAPIPPVPPIAGIPPVPPIAGIPPLGGLPLGGVPPGLPPLGPFGPFGGGAHPLGPNANPNLNYLKSQINQQEESNKLLEEKLNSRAGKKILNNF